METTQVITQEIKEMVLNDILKAKTNGVQACRFPNDRNGEISDYITQQLGLRCYYYNGHPIPGNPVIEISAPFNVYQYYFVILNSEVERAWLDSYK